MRAVTGMTVRVAVDSSFPRTARFELIRCLGKGGMGVVFEALDRERGTRVALKTIQSATPDGLLRFKNEFRLLQDLQHPNLVRLDELFEVDGDWFFTMELIDGVDLLTWLRPSETGAPVATAARAPSRPRQASDHESTDATAVLPLRPFHRDDGPEEAIARRSLRMERLRPALALLIKGLHALHQAGHVHRDVKPANVLVTSGGRLVLLDFGLVTGTGPAVRDGLALGTPRYMAPEQLVGAAVGTAADFYAVGVCLYMALTGRPPFRGSPAQVATLKQAIAPVRPRELAEVPDDLDRLCMDLLRRDPARRPGVREVLSRLGMPPAAAITATGGDPGLVGRRHELATLAESLSDDRHRRAVVIQGESGIGKSALVRHFLAEAERQGCLVLAGRCHERESVPFKALDQVVDSLVQRLSTWSCDDRTAVLGNDLQLLTGAFPAMGRLITVETPQGEAIEPARHPGEGRGAMFVALRNVLARLAERVTTVVSIEDMQWADGDSLALLMRVTQGSDAPAALFCVTYRASDTSGAIALAELRASLGDRTRELHLSPLPMTDSRELVERLLDGRGRATPDDVDALASAAYGHPLFLESLVRHYQQPRRIPSHVRLDDALRAHVAALDPAARRLLACVCLAGRPIPLASCAEAAGVPFPGVARLVGALRGARLITSNGIGLRDSIEPYHDRVRTAVTDAMPRSTRAALYLALANSLGARGGADPEQLAVYFAEAGEPRLASAHAVKAADRAATALAFDQAARLYRMALELDPGPTARGTWLRQARAEALASAGRGAEAADAFLEAARLVAPRVQIELRRRAAEQLLSSGHLDRGLEVLHSVLRSVGLVLPTSTLGALFFLVISRICLAVSGGALRKRRAPPRLTDADRTRMDVCWSAGMGLAFVDPIRGADFQARHIRMALRSGDPYRTACALAAEAGFSAAAGGPRRPRTLALVERASRLAVEVGHPHAIGFAAFAAGAADYLVGEWRSGLDRCDTAERILRTRCTDVGWWRSSASFFALECLAYRGQFREVRQRATQLLDAAHARGDLYAANMFCTGLASLGWLAAGDLEGVRRRIAEAKAAWVRDTFHVQHLGQLLGDVQADLYAGEADRACQRVEVAWPAIRRTALFRVQLTRIATAHQMGRVALASAALGSVRRARLISRARRIARQIAREGMAWAEPLGRLLDAAACRLVGDQESARVHLVAAERGFESAEMEAYAAAASLALGRLLGGDEGFTKTKAARERLVALGIADTEGMAAVLAPGL